MSRIIQVRRISIRCNRIEHWVHLRCEGICLAQYTDTWSCHIQKESRLTTDIPSHPFIPWYKLPTHYPNTTATHTKTHLPHSPSSYRIGKSQTQYSQPLSSTLPRAQHILISYTPPTPLTPHSSLARRLH